MSTFGAGGNSLWGWDDVWPSWTWPGYEGEETDVVVYSACSEVELFLNGKSLGMKDVSRATEYKANWKVKYEPGVLRAKGYRNGNVVAEYRLKSAGKPSKLRLVADREKINADNHDLAYITVEILDENDNLVPYAENKVNFELSGAGTILAVGNSNPISLESFKQPYRKAWKGNCLLVVKSTMQPGEVAVRALSDNLASDAIEIISAK